MYFEGVLSALLRDFFKVYFAVQDGFKELIEFLFVVSFQHGGGISSARFGLFYCRFSNAVDCGDTVSDCFDLASAIDACGGHRTEVYGRVCSNLNSFSLGEIVSCFFSQGDVVYFISLGAESFENRQQEFDGLFGIVLGMVPADGRCFSVFPCVLTPSDIECVRQPFAVKLGVVEVR